MPYLPGKPDQADTGFHYIEFQSWRVSCVAGAWRPCDARHPPATRARYAVMWSNWSGGKVDQEMDQEKKRQPRLQSYAATVSCRQLREDHMITETAYYAGAALAFAPVALGFIFALYTGRGR